MMRKQNHHIFICALTINYYVHAFCSCNAFVLNNLINNVSPKQLHTIRSNNNLVALFSSAASTRNNNDNVFVSPQMLVAKGMDAFRQGKVRESIQFFDEAEEASNGKLSPYLWQRGISYYYVDEFEKGSNQFRRDVSVNPIDVEEIVWDIACINRMHPNITTKQQSQQQRNIMSLPQGKKDRRKIMGAVYSLFHDNDEFNKEFHLALAGNRATTASDEFYALFYLALYCESKGDDTKAEYYMKDAVSSEYAKKSSDYMVSVAKVHCHVRAWDC